MNIYKFAMDMEKGSENLYRELLEKNHHAGMENILKMLINDEGKHMDVLLRAQENVQNIEFTDTTILEDSRMIISDIIGNNEEMEIYDDQFALYEKAKVIELKSKKFYLEKFNESELQIHRDLFQWLASEENKHFIVLENILEHVNRPNTWVENAEFSTTEEY